MPSAGVSDWPPSDWKAHLGRKVSIRYRLHGQDHPYSEAIGVVSGVVVADDGSQIVSILTRTGSSKAIAAPDILAAKLFPV
ncbi:MAG TPA: hypothetical protein VJ927_06040 [Actinomycetota bacterium]|nr:hypothetical protein [Actinomycetota bacterium]